MSNATNLAESIGKLKRHIEIANRMDEIHAKIVDYARQLSEGENVSGDCLEMYHMEMMALISEQERMEGLEEPSANMKAALKLARPNESDTRH